MSTSSFFDQLKERIQAIKPISTVKSVGHITAFGDGIAFVDGLDEVMSGELVLINHSAFALALNLNKASVGLVLLDPSTKIKAGDMVETTGRLLSIGVSDEIIGRVVNPLGEVLDGKSQISVSKYQSLEKIAPGVITRKSVTVPLQTGIKAIDAMIPIGRGQRELIIGDRGTGKSSIALGTILNQKSENVICVYVAIGQKRAFLAQTHALLEKAGAMNYTVIVSASASDPASMQFLAPYSGVSIAEYFLEQGKDVLVIYDDLSKHAVAYREISLLLHRPSGREAYPGDVFYLHSRLLERACRLNEDFGGGSITALPIIETQAGDVSAYIPTNVISITDGQIYLEADLFNAGTKPAINVGLSVSRVGSAAQLKAMKQVAGKMRLDLAQYRELAAFAQFSSDLDPKTKASLDRGARVAAILNQVWDAPLSVEEQVVVIFGATNGYVDAVKVELASLWEKSFLEYMRLQKQSILDSIKKEQKITDETEKALRLALQSFNDLHHEWTI
ncbi:MAG: ATP synthase subunit alpha [Microgenomates group bacterium GW2011_GWF2_45_18]|nr:MAG: ATP synthase subunit alpha [Microgenomates group bacterium GW2011_GWF1_44_10]KKU01543.1 MAG: ATP synthase subunit alpha [Microgenomates group bacterium GW2011_GWF2_45_18]OGJ41631.1 MAG: F0F1 ATP synthase subunit alpha [Candidatus Pacebacteria bacterium RIFOXYB1_FULL_44_10]HAU99451.1 F0F1 ATP synthase subunit alpha [Candidatus Paceibacterota bacterium]HAX01543.1 F0F1 ATP synthase subunit alpha [Candidatus Paceibacterota bacterium]